MSSSANHAAAVDAPIVERFHFCKYRRRATAQPRWTKWTDAMKRTRSSAVVVLVLFCGFITGCATHATYVTGRPQKWVPIAEMRARLAQLRKGIPYEEVKTI